MHQLGVLTWKNTKNSKSEILAELNKWAYDPLETDGYHGNLTFHEDKVYESEEDAARAIAKYDTGWYSDHAVLLRYQGKGDAEPTVIWFVKYEYHC